MCPVAHVAVHNEKVLAHKYNPIIHQPVKPNKNESCDNEDISISATTVQPLSPQQQGPWSDCIFYRLLQKSPPTDVCCD